MLLLTAVAITVGACSQKQKTIQHLSDKQLSKYSQATFAAGCFWHEEAMFESIKGVKEAVSGYAGGNTKNPDYETVGTHAETVNIYYDSSVIDFPTLVKLFFAGQDPTQVNGQGPDEGTQYRTIAFYRNSKEKKIIDDYIKSIQPKYKQPIAAQVMPFTVFYPAEEYHQNYIDKHPNQGYVQSVSIPEIRKLQKEYPQWVKEGFKY